MPRLGDLLVQAGRVTQAQVEEAARAQVAYGGRIGTCLVELDHIEIDELAAFLGRQHKLPMAARRHFERADRDLQALVPAALATRRKVVPIKEIPGEHRRVAIAAMGPLKPDVLAEIGGYLGCEGDDLVVAVAAELRILYNLERVYGVPRPTRFLRTRRVGTDEAPLLAPPASDSGDDIDYVPTPPPEPMSPTPGVREIVLEAESPPAREPPVLEIVAEEPEPFVDEDPTPPPVDGDASERRRFVRTIADDTEPPATHPVTGHALGRIQLVKQQVAPSALASLVEASATTEAIRGGATTSECLRSIRRCRDREQLGALVVDCLDRQSGDSLSASVVFIARGSIAVGWRGFVRGKELAVDQLAIPLDEPSIMARAIAFATAVRRLAPGQAPLGELDERLFEKLGGDIPAYAIAVPITIKEHLIGFVYGQGHADQAGAEWLLVEVGDATRAALTGLLRSAQR
jgi:hypothetical protein